MRFWITKNNELSIHEQLVRQVVLAILSEDLAAGQRLPSVRALAMRCQIHPNTVSAAYHQLVSDGWLELRRGSGLYVCPQLPAEKPLDRLDTLLTGVLQAARSHGFDSDQVLRRMQQLTAPSEYHRVLVVERDPAMRQLLVAELQEHAMVPVEGIDAGEIATAPGTLANLLVALPTRAAVLRRELPGDMAVEMLRLRSVSGSLEEQNTPPPNSMFAVASAAPEFRQWAHAMLIAVGVEPDCVYEVDTSGPDWQARTAAATVIVTDVVAARLLPAGAPYRIFRVISDASIQRIAALAKPL